MNGLRELAGRAEDGAVEDKNDHPMSDEVFESFEEYLGNFSAEVKLRNENFVISSMPRGT